ncbi:indole-3-glycerol phosphate synthase [Liquorilactobacillus sucicola DSM 21376 = JCM 15457]|uniref:Indole-3-glycerol phosphate synthase n=1 Tax=Liquorilactobacillus sucicola DSM 21376 = JCM 15457 TaxID=1423806 RepID=A0A023CZQ8_9LACO|nr:indole-3-glycerol phosphate synthase TrpC [Liquorilactobacillus sucicola]KRN07224.1 hypothetical protein FD15_GL000049 [Liquorilactobacillus sucicola DSM 21376 = JCM 15457]GAJ27357.1 indole-3-glycerol phosphate synthase [Liquorilactobacillus sucicola DSM 21376 = JCM 15457]
MILDELVKTTKQSLKKRQQTCSLNTLKKAIMAIPITQDFIFEKKLAAANLSIIAEIKRASPSKGLLVSDFPYMQIAKEYIAADVAAISVLTEEHYFQGNLKYLKDVATATNTPVLRKDFIIDPYMIYEAKANGASIILLIVAILTDQQLKSYFTLTNSLGMSAIVEVHNKLEIKRALAAGVRIIGINNRNLKNFDVTIETTVRLKEYIPSDILLISESGIKGKKEITQLKHLGVNGVLIGEYFMHSIDKEKAIANFKEVENFD